MSGSSSSLCPTDRLGPVLAFVSTSTTGTCGQLCSSAGGVVGGVAGFCCSWVSGPRVTGACWEPIVGSACVLSPYSKLA